MRKAEIKFHADTAGWLTEDDNGYQFQYDSHYLKNEKAEAISLTLPLRYEPYRSKVLFPFFDGLLPEGWLRDIAVKQAGLNANDRMGLLLACCVNCIGAVSVLESR